MVGITEISIGGKLTSVIQATEDGDIITLRTDQPLLGMSSALEIQDTTVNETENIYFERWYRCTLDGLNWGEWTRWERGQALQGLEVKKNHVFLIEYRYHRVGKSPQVLYFKSAEFLFMYEKPAVPKIYEKMFYKNYFPYHNQDSIKYAMNILEKVYKRGIMPRYLERDQNLNWDDEDYINFWWSVIYLYALNSTYSKVFENILHHTDLLKKYVEQRGIYTSEDNDLAELFYLCNYHYDEIMKRGSLSIFDTDRELPPNYQGDILIKGELMRLLGLTWEDDIIKAVLSSESQGWIVDYKSPLYGINDVDINFIKAYESTVGITDPSLYPVTGTVSYLPVEVKGKQVPAFKFLGSVSMDNGLGDINHENIDKAVLVNSKLSYKMTTCIVTTQPNTKVKLGVKFFDSINVSTTKFFTESKTITLPKAGVYEIDSYVFGEDVENFKPDFNIGIGKNMQFDNDSYIKMLPIVSCDKDMYLWNYKYRVLVNMDFFMVYREEMLLVVEKKSLRYTDEEIEKIIKETLIPYSMNLNLTIV